MGSVWRADHVALNSPVAIKLLNPAIAAHAGMLERFLREAQAAAALRSMHVVQIFDYGVDDGVPFIAMELMKGESLRERIDRVGRLTPEMTARTMNHVARAMGKAHEAGIVHRDLKPDNVFIVTEEEEIAKVLDFGIAKVTQGSLSESGKVATQTGAMLGTPYYMSPEQAQGNKTVDWRSDLWAMAVIAYECLTGKRPFDSDALGDLVLRICTGDAVPPSQVAPVPRGFDEWFARGVQRNPELRFQSARELSEGLSALVGGVSVHTPPPWSGSVGATSSVSGAATTTSGTAVLLTKAVTRRRWPVGLAIAGAGAVFALGAFVALSGSSSPKLEAEAPHASSPSEPPPAAKVEEAPPPPAPTVTPSVSPKEPAPVPEPIAEKKAMPRPAAKRAPTKVPSTSRPTAKPAASAAPARPPTTAAPSDGRNLFDDRKL